MAETLRDRLRRWRFNMLPSYRGTGGWSTYLAADWREVHVKVPLNLWTRNYVGTTFCGSLYAAVAPFYMAMIALNLGTQFLVWDKNVTIHFLKPGRSTLYARFKLETDTLAAIQADLEAKRSTEHVFPIVLADADGVPHVTFEETIYIRRQRGHSD